MNIELRDYFAGQALVGFISSNNYADEPYSSHAEQSYALADAMLEQKRIFDEKQSQKPKPNKSDTFGIQNKGIK